MKHLSEEELIELYYGEASIGASAHERTCRECSARFAELQQTLSAVRSMPTARRGSEYGERVWESLQPRLIPYEEKRRGWTLWAQWRPALLALGCVLLMAGAFAGGRYWERIAKNRAEVVASASPAATKRVVLIVLTDHLDHSERLLVALQHADPSDRAENAVLQSDARQLLASNRLVRTTANHADDPLVTGALDQLEGVLAEIANNPNLTSADLQRVRKEMNAEGILFEIRVLLARRPDLPGSPNHGKGAAI